MNIFLRNLKIFKNGSLRLLTFNLEGCAEMNGKEITVKAPLSGKIVSLKREVGDKVKSGDVLLVFEAMKMENDIFSPSDGVVKEIFVSEGDTVSKGDQLMKIETT